jgi:hypothetical protein
MKKRLIIAFIVVASILLFLGASPWEGTAAIAPNGELPATGYYIATNAYPRNTVVDITNLETGKSTRVIVSNTLTNPGLLAVVSRQAGELIGMRTGSVSRMRMIQPTDPMAYMRFTQSMRDGNPEFDSGNVITEDKLVEQLYKDDTYEKPEIVKAPPQGVRSSLSGYIVDEPEWGGSSRLQIVDLPDYMNESEKIIDVPKEPEYDNTKREVVKDFEIAKDPPEYNSKIQREEVKDAPVFITEAPRNEVEKDVSPKEFILSETSPNPPPSSVYGIDPNDIIPGIVVATPEKPIPVAVVNAIPNTDTIPAPDRNLPVNTIDRLDRGKYYVQVAAMSADLVEGALSQIDRSYAPVVFKGTDNLYRILIGPLNQGESAAILSRFKSIGYKDAFVRKGG